MSALDWVLFGVGMAIGVGALIRLPSYWSGRRSLPLQAVVLPAGVNAPRRGLERALPVATVFILGLLLSGLWLDLDPDPSNDVLRWLQTTALLGVVVLAGLMLSVIWAARPKWCIAPHLRDEPVTLDEEDAADSP